MVDDNTSSSDRPEHISRTFYLECLRELQRDAFEQETLVVSKAIVLTPIIEEQVKVPSLSSERSSGPRLCVWILAGSADEFQAFYSCFAPHLDMTFVYMSRPDQLLGLQSWQTPLLRLPQWRHNNLLANFSNEMTWRFPHWQQSPEIDPQALLELPPAVARQVLARMFRDYLESQKYLNPQSIQYVGSSEGWDRPDWPNRRRDRRFDSGLPFGIDARESMAQRFTFNQKTAQEWCDANGYTDLFEQERTWWAFAPQAVMPVDIRPLVYADWKASCLNASL